MRTFKALAVALTLASTLSVITTTPVPEPGSLKMSVSVPSMNNIMNLMAAILPQQMADNKTINIDYKDRGFFYGFKLDYIHIDELVLGENSMQFIDGTDTVRVSIKGIEGNCTVEGALYTLYYIPLTHASVLNFTDLTVQADFAAVAKEDGVYWQLQSAVILSIGDVKIKTTSSFFNSLLKLAHSYIMKSIREGLPKIEAMYASKIATFNQELLNGTQFMVDVIGSSYPLNLTTTKAPVFDGNTGLITANFDGTFFDTIQGTTHNERNMKQVERVSGLNSNQIFLHQSSVSSMLFGMQAKYLPHALNDTNMTEAFLAFIPEIQSVYGADAKVEIEMNVKLQTGKFLALSKESGIKIGHDETVEMTHTVYCSNANVAREEALSFTSNFKGTFNITLDSLYIYVNIPSVEISNTKITFNKVGAVERDYSTFFQTQASAKVEAVNNEWAEPYDPSVKIPTLAFIRSMIKDTRVTPFIEDEYLYAGFTYFLDFNVQTIPQAAIISKRIGTNHGQEIVQAVQEAFIL